ncbi:FcoT family thioesterase [Corynebacterium alimapuense]|uniref:(2E)-enoyl-[ACP] glycyltransferase n=1 Tax=Corynebacterium alimapuense TaxID=1576874 RepID=A0A3M8K9X7_9CORY|nr:FcoT family thioesterase [Corynebacterium alimapuense]RNE50023.1 hypothetical protein C5L39_01240 [Corynebacterium alimapuense]
MTFTIIHQADSALLNQCLDPYRAKDAIYLQELEFTHSEAGISSRGSFGIDESCYIDDTGHFNAAEFIMCYNQLMYATIAVAVNYGGTDEFAGWNLQDYWDRQLPNVLIQEFWSRYSRPISARRFQGEFTIDQVDRSRLDRGILKLSTSVSFHDEAGGRARGTVLLALTDLPEPAVQAAISQNSGTSD